MKLTHNLLVLVLAMNCCALFAGEQHRNQGVQKPETIAAMHSMMPQKQEPMEAQNPKKRELITAFAADIAFISRIIAEGEKDDKERTAFSGIFAQQLRWFEDTLRSSNGPEDDAWKAALAKKLLIKTIVKHQEEADAFLDTVAKRQGVDDAMQKSVRLAVLYALNTRLQGKVQKTIDAQEIEQLVMESVAKVTKKPEMAQGASVQQSAKSVQVCEPLLIEPIAQTKMAPMVNPLALELKNANESLELLKQKSLLEQGLVKKMLEHQFKLQADEHTKNITKIQQEKDSLELKLKNLMLDQTKNQSVIAALQQKLTTALQQISMIKAQTGATLKDLTTKLATTEQNNRLALQKAEFAQKIAESMQAQDRAFFDTQTQKRDKEYTELNQKRVELEAKIMQLEEAIRTQQEHKIPLAQEREEANKRALEQELLG